MMVRTLTAKSGLCGILPVNKPEGITSHDVVDRVRKILGVRKVGHTGTLDPKARGLLLLCVGGATRFAGYMSKQDKTYRAVINLGASTSTDDTEGETIFKYEGALESLVSRQRVEAELESFTGITRQVPPVYCSKKVDGVPAYVLARRGQKPDLKPVTVRIDWIRLLELDLPQVEIELRCSAGMYLRALARDLGSRLGCGGHLASLLRTAIGDFTLERSITFARLCRASLATIEKDYLYPVEHALSAMSAVELSHQAVEKIYFGQSVELGAEGVSLIGEGLTRGPHNVRMHDRQKRFLGVGLLDLIGPEAGVLRPKRLMIEAFPFEATNS